MNSDNFEEAPQNPNEPDTMFDHEKINENSHLTGDKKTSSAESSGSNSLIDVKANSSKAA